MKAIRASTLERIVPFAIALVVIVAFLPAMHNGFVSLDDKANFIENTAFRGLGGSQLKWMWSTTLMGHFIPLSWMTLGLDYVVWGMNPAGYHLTNVLLHAADAVLLYFLARRLLTASHDSAENPPNERRIVLAAACAALLWAVHPLRVESVAWITERRDVLSCLFFFGSILTYLVAVERGSARMWWYLGALGLFIAAMLSKAASMALPAVLLLLNVYPLRRVGGSEGWTTVAARRVYLELVPFGMVAVAAALLSILVLHPPAQLALSGKLAVSAYSLAFYLWKTIAPFGLSPMYELPQRIDPFEARFLIAYVVVLASTAAAWRARAKWPGFVTCAAAFVVMTLPMLGIVQNGPQIAADRYTYFGGAALAIGIAGCLFTWRSNAVPVVLGGAVLGLAALTWNQTKAWGSSATLWTHALRVNERSVFAHVGLAMVDNAEGDYEGAVRHFTRAVEINPRYDEGFNNLGNALVQLGRADDAVRQYEQALSLNPRLAEAHSNLGSILARQGEPQEAIDHYRQALAVKPDYAAAHSNWGVALARMGDVRSAIAHYEQAVALDPTYADAYLNWGNALLRMDDPASAESRYATVLRLRPVDFDAHKNLGVAFAQQGKAAEATSQFREALAIRPDDDEVKGYLARMTVGTRDSSRRNR